MGIPGLWKVKSFRHMECANYFASQLLKPAAQSRTFTQVAVTEGFDPYRRGIGTLFIGIDARYESYRFNCRVFFVANHACIVFCSTVPNGQHTINMEVLICKLVRMCRFRFSSGKFAASSHLLSRRYLSSTDPSDPYSNGTEMSRWPHMPSCKLMKN